MERNREKSGKPIVTAVAGEDEMGEGREAMLGGGIGEAELPPPPPSPWSSTPPSLVAWIEREGKGKVRSRRWRRMLD
ncbi:hypothetical protein GUJ93_ZPchr0008g13743 [Zizania palustris]|uniref:Uncharacterized protein n=1 Tax=Zizania palustris TaxID=103762 RepID=A0A8J5VK40_ZIZPA|nr:hypothetical protein GUJ93_ZPchr0008g13743 [Zizania palustris]